MGLALDIILICIVILFVVIGIKRGFVKEAARFAGTLVSAVLASYLGGMLAAWVFSTFFRPGLVERINESISGIGGVAEIENFINSLPDFIVRALEFANISVDGIMQSIRQQQGETADMIADAVSPVFIGFLKVLAVIVLFMIFMIAVRVLADVISNALHLPLISQVNGLLGGVFGLLMALMTVWIIVSAINVFTPMLETKMREGMNAMIESSFVAKYFIDFNPLNFMFS